MYGLLTHGARELIGLQRGPRKSKRKRLSRRFRQRIFVRDKGCCRYCGNKVAFDDCTMDHVTPLTLRGKARSKENIVTSCNSCNKKKGALQLENLDDLAPEMLALEFVKVYEEIAKRKGQFVLTN